MARSNFFSIRQMENVLSGEVSARFRKTLLAILVALCSSLALAEDFKTINGKEYKNATVSRLEADGIVIKFHGGIAKIFYVELPPEIQKKYGYDPEAEMQQKARAADLMSQAESALRTGQFGKGAELLNQIVSECPTSRQAQTVYNLRAFLREKEQTQSGPLTASEAQRLRSLMDALANIKKGYRTATPEKRHALDYLRSRDVPRHRQRLGFTFIFFGETSRLDRQSTRRILTIAGGGALRFAEIARVLVRCSIAHG